MGSSTVKMIDALANISRLCIDTMPFIYYVEENPLYVDLVQVVIDRLDEGELEAVSSIITLTEVLTLPIRLQNGKLEQAYRFVLLDSGNFELISITEPIASCAAHLRAVQPQNA
jgi:predicted nucleic acid-binding protein